MSFETTAAIVLFPLLLPVWQERPFLPADLNPGPYPIVMPKEPVELQKEAFRFNDAEFRGRLAIQLRRAGSLEAGRVLFWQLREEPVPAVRATILEQLRLMAATLNIAPNAIAPYLEDPSPVVRQSALLLYARLKDAALAKLTAMAETDADPGVRATALEVIAAYFPEPGKELLRKSWQDPVPALRATTLKAGLGLKSAATAAEAFIMACADPAPTVREALAQTLPQAPRELAQTLAGKLADDSHVSVRISVAQSIPEMKNPALLPVLLKLADDPDPEVRRNAAAGLVAYPAPEGVAKAVALFNDPMNLVRWEAEEAVVKLHPHSPAVATVAATLHHDNPWVRYHVCHTLGRLKAVEWREKIAVGLESEIRAENLAAVIYALWQLEAKFAGTAILKFSDHKSPMVREQVAIACGVLAPAGGNAVLKLLVFDPDRTVRPAAILAMGRLADGDFSGTILEILKCTNGEKNISSEDRRFACWTAGRLRPIDIQLMERLRTQAITPVIPTMMGPAYEDDTVLLSASFGLVQCARDNAEVKPLSERVLIFHATKPDPNRSSGPMSYFPTAEILEYTRQAKAWLENQKIEPLPRPTSEISLPYRRVEKRTE